MDNGANTPRNPVEIYESPLLVRYGDLAELTQASGTSTMADSGDKGKNHKTS
jgi:hypothetical protein